MNGPGGITYGGDRTFRDFILMHERIIEQLLYKHASMMCVNELKNMLACPEWVTLSDNRLPVVTRRDLV